MQKYRKSDLVGFQGDFTLSFLAGVGVGEE